MKKSLFALILAWLLFFSITPVVAQQKEADVFYISATISTEGVIRINRGDGVSANKPNTYLVVGDDGQKLKAGSRIQGINYMSEKGWRVVLMLDYATLNHFLMYKKTDGYDKESIDRLFNNLNLKIE